MSAKSWVLCLVAMLSWPTDALAQASAYINLSQPVAARCAVIGDSNVALAAAHAVGEGQHLTTPAGPVVLFDFIGAVFGLGLRDMPALLTRLSDPRVAQNLGSYDCVVLNIGINDIRLENPNWLAFFHGTYSSQGPPMPYRQRVQTLLSALPNVPIYWIGPHSSSTDPSIHPWEVAAVNLTLLCIDDPASAPTWCDVGDPRLRFVNPDPLIAGVTPRLFDSVHYNAASTTLIWRHVVARILAGN